MAKNEESGLFGRSSPLFIFYYLFLVHGVISGIISGGVEFAIAYGMYYHSSRPVTLWRFPHTLSGDCALTVFIQVGVTWVCDELIVGWGCYRNETPLLPLEIELPDEANHELFYRLFEVRHGIPRDEPSLRNYLRGQFIRYPSRSRCFNLFAWLLSKFVISMIVAAMIWFWVWPVTMGVLAGVGTPVGGHEYEFHGWAPQITKLIFGFVIGLMCSPLGIIVILLRDKWFIEYKKRAQTGLQQHEKQGPAATIDNSSGETNTNSTNPSA